MDITLEAHELLEVFGESDPTAHRQEAEQQWWNSYAWTESHHRASTYTKADWQRMQADISAAKRDVLASGSHRAMGLAEQHRAYLEPIGPSTIPGSRHSSWSAARFRTEHDLVG